MHVFSPLPSHAFFLLIGTRSLQEPQRDGAGEGQAPEAGRREHAAAVKDGELHAAFLVKREASKLAGEHLKEIACKSVPAWLF